MILLNFGHPLTPGHLAHVRDVIGEEILDLHEIKTHFDHHRPFAEQVTALVDSIQLTPQAWQTEPILINPPAHNVIAATLLAELHGRMGYFPAVLRLKPVADSTPPQFEVAEVINLQAVRDMARERR